MMVEVQPPHTTVRAASQSSDVEPNCRFVFSRESPPPRMSTGAAVDDSFFRSTGGGATALLLRLMLGARLLGRCYA